MKKIILLLILIISLIVITGCYDNNDTATVRINLGNLPLAKQVEQKSLIDKILCFFSKEAYAYPSGNNLSKLHLVALKGDFRIALKSLDISTFTEGEYTDIVELDVPAGDNITIAVLGEIDLMPIANIQNIKYYGKTEKPVILAAGDVTTVSIQMNDISNIINLEVTETANGQDHLVTWNSIPGSTNYYLEFQPQEDPWGLIYLGQSNFFLNVDGVSQASMYYRLTIEFSYINKSTDYLNYL